MTRKSGFLKIGGFQKMICFLVLGDPSFVISFTFASSIPVKFTKCSSGFPIKKKVSKIKRKKEKENWKKLYTNRSRWTNEL